MLCFAAASVISRVQWLRSWPAVLFSFTQHMTSEPNHPPRPAHSRAALHRSVLVSCSERPSRCYTELPRSLAGRLRSRCNQAVQCMCVLPDSLAQWLRSLSQQLFSSHLISVNSQPFPHCSVSASALSQASL